MQLSGCTESGTKAAVKVDNGAVGIVAGGLAGTMACTLGRAFVRTFGRTLSVLPWTKIIMLAAPFAGGSLGLFVGTRHPGSIEVNLKLDPSKGNESLPKSNKSLPKSNKSLPKSNESLPKKREGGKEVNSGP